MDWRIRPSSSWATRREISSRPIVEAWGEIASEDAQARERARMAHWASLTEEPTVQASQVPVRGKQEGCLLADRCASAGICLWAHRRERAIAVARASVHNARHAFL